jgi:hypothetical protein
MPAVHPVRGERREFEEGRAGVEQAFDAAARQQLAAGEVPLARGGRAAPGGGGGALGQQGEQPGHVRGALAESRAARVELRGDAH